MLAQGHFVEQRCVAAAESIVALVDSMTRRPMQIPSDTAHALRSISAPGAHAPTTARGHKTLRDHLETRRE